MVLNIFGKKANGDGGLMIALEVPSPCGKPFNDLQSGEWVEVDRSRCSSRYPCSLRLPAAAARSTDKQPTKFRTRVVQEYEDYGTDFLEYQRVTLDHDSEVKVAHESFSND